MTQQSYSETSVPSEKTSRFKQWAGSSRGIILIIFLTVSMLLSLNSYYLYRNFEGLVIGKLGENATNVAVTAARFIEQDLESYLALSEEYETGNHDKAYYLKMNKLFQDLKQQTGASFIFTGKQMSETEMVYILDGEDPGSDEFSPIGSIDHIAEPTYRVFTEGIVLATDLMEWESWGKFLTGYAPIFDETGKVTGLVGVDFSIEYVYELLADIRAAIIFGTAALILLATYGGFRLFVYRQTVVNMDYLTRLHSRRYHDMMLQEQLRKAQMTKQPFSLMMIDIDLFKKINDQYGHGAGDSVLRSIAQVIRANTRSIDICSRYGGDEFVIILPGTNLEQAKIIGGRITQKLKSGDDSLKEVLGDTKISVSIGIAEWREGMDSQQLAEIADEAMYLSKHHSRSTSAIYGAV